MVPYGSQEGAAELDLPIHLMESLGPSLPVGIIFLVLVL